MDKSDDKVSFIIGVKDLVYVKIIEIKNYVVVFEVSFDRLDVCFVLNCYGVLINFVKM